jgi:hypothetical protein
MVERKKPGVRHGIKYWLRKRRCNQCILVKIKEEFPRHRTSVQQVKNERSLLHTAGVKIPTSPEARREEAEEHQRTINPRKVQRR